MNDLELNSVAENVFLVDSQCPLQTSVHMACSALVSVTVWKNKKQGLVNNYYRRSQ
jgi:hypothetical protein